ncbi:MAG: YihY/virulence factor BrkB family protein [Caulobacteraceae bacterium]|nr:YihY/virulence factor BrkB family protein [Caulobacteraceae bacterium]
MTPGAPRHFDANPYHWARESLRVVAKALTRLWGRNVMLYTGGVSFFALLAAFPTLALVIGVYSLLLTPEQAIAQADKLAMLLPDSAGDLFQAELLRLSHAPIRIVSTQSGIAGLISLYAAHRGFKALIAGLSFIHDEKQPRGFLGFNILAFVVLVVAIGLVGAVSSVFLALRILGSTLDLTPMRGVQWFYSEWTWTSLGVSLGMTLVYRFAMSTDPVDWRASIAGGVSAAFLTLAASWASAIYAKQFAQFGATYGSIAAVVVLLVWLSWSVNAVFFGGALATEIELALAHKDGRAMGFRTQGPGTSFPL